MLPARFGAPGGLAQIVSGNSARYSVFDLPVWHLHPVIALHIITKFLA